MSSASANGSRSAEHTCPCDCAGSTRRYRLARQPRSWYRWLDLDSNGHLSSASATGVTSSVGGGATTALNPAGSVNGSLCTSALYGKLWATTANAGTTAPPTGSTGTNICTRMRSPARQSARYTCTWPGCPKRLNSSRFCWKLATDKLVGSVLPGMPGNSGKLPARSAPVRAARVVVTLLTSAV